MARTFIVGAGLAGLSAAVALCAKGVEVEVIEGASQAGGRCRSYFDPQLGQVIDNGNHLLLAGNHATMDYVKTIGAEDALVGPDATKMFFVDIRDGARWAIAPNNSALPIWLMRKESRVPGTRARDYLELLRLVVAPKGKRLCDVIACKGALWERLLRPFFLGALNTQPETASAALAGALVRETFARGGKAYRPRIAQPTLAAAFVDPALGFIADHGGSVRFGRRVRSIVFTDGEVAALEAPEATLPVNREDSVILAVPPWVAGELVPGLTVPDAFSSIVNAHFKVAAPAGAPGMLGVIGGVAEWIFSFPDRISVTVSAADAIVDASREELAKTLWSDVQRALCIEAPLPPWQIVKERRATFAATPQQNARRPGAATARRNFFLAGDWTDTGLPATIEGAVRSGRKAASLALAHTSL